MSVLTPPPPQPEIENPQHHNSACYDHPILQMEAEDREFTDKPMADAVTHKDIL